MKGRLFFVLAVVLVGLSASIVYAGTSTSPAANPNAITVPPVSLPSIVCASGIGGARCEFIIHSQADLAFLSQLCAAGKLPAVACKFISSASVSFTNAQACSITLALSVQELSQSCTALSNSGRRNRLCSHVINAKNLASIVSTAKGWLGIPPSVLAVDGTKIVPAGFTCSRAIASASEFASIGVTVANLSASFPSNFETASTGQRWG